jgi:hypothetical protein
MALQAEGCKIVFPSDQLPGNLIAIQLHEVTRRRGMIGKTVDQNCHRKNLEGKTKGKKRRGKKQNLKKQQKPLSMGL